MVLVSSERGKENFWEHVSVWRNCLHGEDKEIYSCRVWRMLVDTRLTLA